MFGHRPDPLDQIDQIGGKGCPLLRLTGGGPTLLQARGERDHVRHVFQIPLLRVVGQWTNPARSTRISSFSTTQVHFPMRWD
jgi:hypothetical protein